MEQYEIDALDALVRMRLDGWDVEPIEVEDLGGRIHLRWFATQGERLICAGHCPAHDPPWVIMDVTSRWPGASLAEAMERAGITPSEAAP